MKKDIHPNLKPLTLIIGKDQFVTKSTYGRPELLVDIDFRKHHAWTGKSHSISTSNQNINKFSNRFGDIFS
jgi:ribosomal protein L31